MNRLTKFLLATLVCLTIAPTCIAQRPDPISPQVQTLQAFAQLLERRDVDVDELAKSALSESSFNELKKQVNEIRILVARNDSVEIIQESDTRAQLKFGINGKVITVAFEMTTSEPVRVKNINVTSADFSSSKSDDSPFTWDQLEKQMDAEAENVFEGAVLITRNGKVVLQKGYGFANREKRIKNSIDTVFAIGSQPIDFTHVAIMKLKDLGKLSLTDPIDKYFENVPSDKKSITIHHLMTGRSGFPDFHDLQSDVNPDHSWIDRDEAIKRMLNHKLLFEPGTGNQHSHSAWGMLAAIVEIASGKTYPEFTREHLFEPAGMNDTGFFGEDVSESRIAVGYGEQKSSEPNSPPNWGKTSWLVMGSGGQVSTLGDILKWERAIKDGILLSPESTQTFLRQHNGLAADGDMFGFEFVHSYDPDSLFLLISNSVDSRQKRQAFMRIGRKLQKLVQGTRNGREQTEVQTVQSKFTLGIEMGVGDEGQVIVDRVIEGSGAEKGGMQTDDQIISANQKQITDDPLAVLGPLLQSNHPIEFVVERNGRRETLTVTPLPRK